MVLDLVLCILAALVPSVLLYFPNMGEIAFGDMLPYFGIMILLGVAAYFVMLLITRRKALAALSAAAGLLIFLNVGRLVPAIKAVNDILSGAKFVLLACILVWVGLFFLMKRGKEELLKDIRLVAALALAAFLLTTAVPNVISSLNQGESATGASDLAAVSADTEAENPNIYWIVSDEYAGNDELMKYLMYDNTPFYAWLRERGFTVSDHTYNWATSTYHILRDALYLDYLPGEENKVYKKQVADPDAPMWTLLRGMGYSIYELETSSKFNLIERMAEDDYREAAMTEEGETVAALLLRYSIFYKYEQPILERLLPEQAAATERERLQQLFSWASDTRHWQGDQNACTVIYFKSPHVPFYFDANGGEVAEENWRNFQDYNFYLGQLQYVTKQIQAMVDAILTADPNCILVVQGDHGYRRAPNVINIDSGNALNAVYFQGKPLEEIQDANLLNTWITVLNTQFGTELPHVEERRMDSGFRESAWDPEAYNPNQDLLENQ